MCTNRAIFSKYLKLRLDTESHFLFCLNVNMCNIINYYLLICIVTYTGGN